MATTASRSLVRGVVIASPSSSSPSSSWWKDSARFAHAGAFFGGCHKLILQPLAQPRSSPRFSARNSSDIASKLLTALESNPICAQIPSYLVYGQLSHDSLLHALWCAAVQKEAVVTDKAPAALGPYSQAIKSGNLVFCSGVLGLVPEVYDMKHRYCTHIFSHGWIINSWIWNCRRENSFRKMCKVKLSR